jgi:hypothetical protein
VAQNLGLKQLDLLLGSFQLAIYDLVQWILHLILILPDAAAEPVWNPIRSQERAIWILVSLHRPFSKSGSKAVIDLVRVWPPPCIFEYRGQSARLRVREVPVMSVGCTMRSSWQQRAVLNSSLSGRLRGRTQGIELTLVFSFSREPIEVRGRIRKCLRGWCKWPAPFVPGVAVLRRRLLPGGRSPWLPSSLEFDQMGVLNCQSPITQTFFRFHLFLPVLWSLHGRVSRRRAVAGSDVMVSTYRSGDVM